MIDYLPLPRRNNYHIQRTCNVVCGGSSPRSTSGDIQDSGVKYPIGSEILQINVGITLLDAGFSRIASYTLWIRHLEPLAAQAFGFVGIIQSGRLYLNLSRSWVDSIYTATKLHGNHEVFPIFHNDSPSFRKWHVVKHSSCLWGPY